MDFTGIMGSMGGAGLQLILLIITIIFTAVFVVAIILGIGKIRRYNQFKCIIWEKDGFGQLNQWMDKAGIFVESKTQNKRFYMRKAGVGLNPDNVPYIPYGADKVVFLYKDGLKNYHFIKPTIKDRLNGNSNNPDINLQVGEEDVNWALHSYEKAKKTFSSSVLLQYMPFIALGFVTIIILIIFIYFFKEFGTLRDTAEALKEGALALREANLGTTVI